MTAELITLPISSEANITAPSGSTPAEAAAVPSPPPPSQSPTMWDLETNLAALADSIETVEPEREQKRRDFFTRTLERVEGYLELILRNLGKDAKGKSLKLEGGTPAASP